MDEKLAENWQNTWILVTIIKKLWNRLPRIGVLAQIFLMRTIKMKMVYILYPTVSLEVLAALQN